MRESLDFHTDVAQPVILITRATYGELHGNDTSKIIDVTNDIQAQVDGRTLTIEREVNLNKLFHWDPSPGMPCSVVSRVSGLLSQYSFYSSSLV